MVSVWRASSAFALLAGCAFTLAAVFEPREFSNPANEAVYHELTEELRCLVCQNQNIASSDADLASDLRREVYERLESGESKQDIVDFMTARYGDFVLYRPPFNGVTLTLWAAPAILGVVGLLVAARTIGRSRAPVELNADEAQRLQQYLQDDARPDQRRRQGGAESDD